MIVFAILSPMLAWWGASRFFAGQFSEWKRNSDHWRAVTDKRLEAMELALQSSSYAVMSSRLQRAEQDILDLREWKHVRADPYISAVDVLKTRVDALAQRRDER